MVQMSYLCSRVDEAGLIDTMHDQCKGTVILSVRNGRVRRVACECPRHEQVGQEFPEGTFPHGESKVTNRFCIICHNEWPKKPENLVGWTPGKFICASRSLCKGRALQYKTDECKEGTHEICPARPVQWESGNLACDCACHRELQASCDHIDLVVGGHQKIEFDTSKSDEILNKLVTTRVRKERVRRQLRVTAKVR